MVDHTEHTPRWLIEWAQSDPELRLVYNGYGEAIWLQEGEVLKRLSGSGMMMQADLAETTKETF
ncbi:hypothetical protein [Mariniblastus fucicola]|uniref:hypothetical protein n=1 Tax=Mariniblastus fucicola TaxID=980251 RepID=UPI0011E01CB4|nr:hypothetical protein [Mariniblastus fucicola]